MMSGTVWKKSTSIIKLKWMIEASFEQIEKKHPLYFFMMNREKITSNWIDDDDGKLMMKKSCKNLIKKHDVQKKGRRKIRKTKCFRL